MKATVFHVVSNKVWGGGEQFVLDLSRRQISDGWNVSFFCRPIKELTSRLAAVNAPIYRLPLIGLADMRSAWQMAKKLRIAGRSIVHVHNVKDAFTAVYARKLSGNKQARVIVTRHLAKQGKTRWPYTWLYRNIDAISFVSEFAKEAFLSSNPPIAQERICVIHNSVVVPPHIAPCDIRQAYNIADDMTIGMYHGRLHQEKGLDILLEAICQLRDKPFVMVIIGKGSSDYTQHLENIIQSNGLKDKVILAGFRDDIMSCIACADFGVVPSIVRESFSLAALEYLSQGRPVVATDNGGQTDFLTNRQNSLLVQANDSHQLANGIATLVDNASLRRQLGQQGLSDFKSRFDYEHFYNNMRKLYERTL